MSDSTTTKPKPDTAALRTNPPVHMSLAEAAIYIGVSARTLWEEVSKRRVKVARVRSRLIFKRSELDRYVDLLTAQSA